MQYPDYTIVGEEHLTDLESDCLVLRHDKTGAEIIILNNSDEDKAFVIGFRTIPSDSTGVAHILEHSVLNGSRKYPVKDPFLHMIKTSLKTFLNAFTYPEVTAYPVASQNEQDFYNLVDVYLDAVFFPNISENIFKQEGWHYEIAAVDQALSYKGVVFNEMKGSMANPSSIFWDKITAGLFPDTSYAFNSGGDPEFIPNLTYKQFKDFHAKYYHPSNARIYFYGNGDTKKHLAKLSEYLDLFDAQPIDTTAARQAPFIKPVKVKASYPAGAEQQPKSYSMMSWAIEVPDTYTNFMWEIVDNLLQGSDASILRNRLLESGLGEGLTGWGLVQGMTQPIYMIGLKGVEHKNVQAVQDLILKVLAKMVEELPKEQVEAAINTLEFAKRELETSSARGLEVWDWMFGTWYFGLDPLGPVKFGTQFDKIRSDFASNPKLFNDFLKHNLLENMHRVDFEMNPDSDLTARNDRQEKERLEKIKQQMTQAELEKLVAAGEQFTKWQQEPDSPEAVAKVPVLKLEDMPKNPKDLPTELTSTGDTPTYVHTLNSRGISYFSVGFDISDFSETQFADSALVSDLITRLGTKNKTFEQLALEIDSETGGIGTDLINGTVFGSERRRTLFTLEGKAFTRNQPKLLDLMRQVLLDIELDNKSRVKQVLMELKADMESGIVYNGHLVAKNRALAAVSQTSAVDEICEGITNLEQVRDLAKHFEDRWPDLLQRMVGIREQILSGAPVYNFTSSEEGWHQLSSLLQDTFKFGAAAQVLPSQIKLGKAGEGYTIPAEVNYVALASDLNPLGYKMHGSVLAAGQLLRGDYLWNKVRVQGGAYGCMFTYDMYENVIGFTSYRDPNIEQTLDAYKKAGEYLSSSDFSVDDVEGAIIGAIGKLDLPLQPSEKGDLAFKFHLYGMTDQLRQQIRDELLTTTKQDLHKFGEILTQAASNGKVVVLGNSEKLSAFNSNTSSLEIKPLL